MKNLLGGSHAEHWTSLTAGGIGCLLLAFAWMEVGSAITAQHIGLALLLAGCVVAADSFPIHIRYATKISLISLPLFLIMVLLPLPLALLAAGVGILGADFLARSSRGLLFIDFIQDPARWIIILFAGGAIAHFEAGSAIDSGLLLVTAAAVMFFLDVVTFSLFTSLNIHESFLGLAREGFVNSYEIESIQYLIGILGALAFQQATWSLLLLFVPIFIFYKVFKKVRELNSSTRELLETMADTVDLRDRYTGGHSRRVAELAGCILKQMKISGVEADLINTAARLHDIGKIGITDEILRKPGELTPEEWQVMRSHPYKGAELLKRYVDFKRGSEMVLYHHERWDGKGYPLGLKGSDIPFGARVIAVADAFDAMTTERPYRGKKTQPEAVQILEDGSGTQWNKEVVDALLASLKAEL